MGEKDQAQNSVSVREEVKAERESDGGVEHGA